MGRRGPAPLSIREKTLKGTLKLDRELKRVEQELERPGNVEFVRAVMRFFLNERETDPELNWIREGLVRDTAGVTTRLWHAYKADFRKEFKRKYPGKAEPWFWSDLNLK